MFQVTMESIAAGFDIYLDDTEGFDLDFKERVSVPPYEGEYETVSLAREDTVLPTKNHRMTQDILVHKIPYAVTPNEYGDTVSISS